MIRRLRYQVSPYIFSLGIVFLATGICYFLQTWIGYQTIALVFLVIVSLLATTMTIWPVLLAAWLSALSLNFFFIPPRYTFHIREADDVLMFAMYFLVALVNAVFTHKLKQQEKKIREKEEKEKAIHLYNTLFNSLSHELKTPIATIIGATDALHAGSPDLSEKTSALLLTEISIAANRLHRMVENLLHMSRLESGMLRLKRDWCDMPEMIHRIMQKFEPEQQKRIRFQPDLSLPYYKLDIGLMEQVVFNLLDNALRHTPDSGEVVIRIANENEICRLTIDDQGPGIPPGQVSDIFNPFVRLPSSGYGGTGLGLSIARGITEAHGGTIKVENLISGGARFSVLLPAETSYLNFIKHE